MSRASSRLVHGYLRLHNYTHIPKPSSPNSTAASSFRDSLTRAHHSAPAPPPNRFGPPGSSNAVLTRIPSPPKHHNPDAFWSRAGLGLRFFSFKSSDLGKANINANFAKKVFEKPAAAVASTFSRYRGALGLQIEAFFSRNYLVLLGAGALVACALLWRIMFGVANTFIGFSEGMAKYGFLALSSAIVAFAGLYVRSRYTINPDRVYRIAMRKLNTSAGILEVMGAPLSGSELRAYVMSGGGLTIKNFKPRFRSKRCFLIFPIRGSERKGLVSVEVKKKKGQYDMKLLAVDIPMASGPDQRLFLVGDEEEYKVGGGLISELRDPVVKAMSAAKEFDDLDQIEEEEDAEREMQEAEKKHQEEIEKLEKDGR
ncbi:import inner membrane translocase subunit [Trema orientale]|uniref:Import inner membrane translocase subunit n=1 Tax=Trema orientale TaxID=63057 RepID=A0A2P5BIN4_TREOI|nr:import inner membrane translocase subunit [Trema orientale]